MKLIDFTQLSEIHINDIYIWRNVDNIRYNSFNKNKISLVEHRKFIESLKTDTTKKYLLVLQHKEAVGVISFTNIFGKKAYVGYYKNPNIEKKGIGKLLIKEAVKYARNLLGIDLLIMQVYKENIASQNCIIQNDFIEYKRDDEIIEYRLNLNENK